MGTSCNRSDRERRAGKEEGCAVASQKLSGCEEQVHAMCSVPFNSVCTDCGEENFKMRVNCIARGEQSGGWLPSSTPSSICTFINGVNGSFQSCFSDFVSYLKRFPAGDDNNLHECRFHILAVIIGLLEDRNAEIVKETSQQIVEHDACYRSQVNLLTRTYEQQLIENESRSQGKVQELSRELQTVSKNLLDAQAQLRSTVITLNSAQSEIQDRENAVRVLKRQLEDEMRQKQDSKKRSENIQKNMDAQKENFENERLRFQEVVESYQHYNYRLHSTVIEEKEKAVEKMEADTSELISEWTDMKAELAAIEQKIAQDGHVNLSMLENARESVNNRRSSAQPAAWSPEFLLHRKSVKMFGRRSTVLGRSTI